MSGTVLRDNGKYPFTVSRTGNTYTVNLSVPYSFPYGVIASAESNFPYGNILYGSRTSTSFRLAASEGPVITLSFLMLTYDSGLG